MDLPARLGGHRLLHRAGIVRPRERFVRREVYDYGHVVHDLQLNAWVLAYRRAAGDAFLSWDGETHIEPPREARVQQGVLRVGDHWSAEGLRDPRARLVRPDAVLEVGRPDGDGSRVLFIEYDRTRRVDKNYEKFRRYDTFLCWWWQHTSFADGDAGPPDPGVRDDCASRDGRPASNLPGPRGVSPLVRQLLRDHGDPRRESRFHRGRRSSRRPPHPARPGTRNGHRQRTYAAHVWHLRDGKAELLEVFATLDEALETVQPPASPR